MLELLLAVAALLLLLVPLCSTVVVINAATAAAIMAATSVPLLSAQALLPSVQPLSCHQCNHFCSTAVCIGPVIVCHGLFGLFVNKCHGIK